MRLLLLPGEGLPQSFWVTRRQWLGLLHALATLPPTVAPAPPPSRQRRLSTRAEAGQVAPLPLQAIRLRRLAEGVKLVFVTGKAGVSATLSNAGVAQLQDLLRQQAERAGWDAKAALARLHAGAMASAAMRKASQLH